MAASLVKEARDLIFGGSWEESAKDMAANVVGMTLGKEIQGVTMAEAGAACAEKCKSESDCH